MLLIISWIIFILLTILLIGALLYVIGLFVGPVFGAPFVPTQQKYVEDIVRLSGVKPGHHVIDLGCGDGRIVRAFAASGAHAVGYEVNPMLVWLSRIKSMRQLKGSTQFVLGNFVNHDLSRYDIIITYLMPPMMVRLEKKLLKELKLGACVVSNSFRFPNWQPIAQEGHLYVYEKTIDQAIPETDTRLV